MSSVRRVPPPPPPGFGDDDYYRLYGRPEDSARFVHSLDMIMQRNWLLVVGKVTEHRHPAR